jgi:cellulose synthase/poly-beta-1,6-N-acetylglucosamine synthase-like glycosyltransferase
MMTFVFLFAALLIAYVIILICLYKGLRQVTLPAANDTPAVSVIISMHNEEKNIPGLLTALLNQDYPSHLLEIIFIDDRSTDATHSLLEKAHRDNPYIKVISIANLQKNFAPKKRAIDTAINHACGEIILLTDADGRPGPRWIKTMVQYFDQTTGMVLGYAPYSSRGLISHMLALEYFSHAVVAAATTGLGFPLTCVGTNLAYRKCVYSELNGFGKYRFYHSGDDDLFMQRVRDESAWNIRYATDPQSHVWNAPPVNWIHFLNQRLRYASKGFFYPRKILFILILAFLLNVLFVILAILGFFIPYSATVFWVGIGIKIIGEYAIMCAAKNRLGETRKLYLMPLLSILHIPYVVFFALFAQILKFQWAGRSK